MAAWRRPDWKAGNTRERPPPPRFSAPLPAREPCSGLCGMSIGMTTDKTAREQQDTNPSCAHPGRQGSVGRRRCARSSARAAFSKTEPCTNLRNGRARRSRRESSDHQHHPTSPIYAVR